MLLSDLLAQVVGLALAVVVHAVACARMRERVVKGVEAPVTRDCELEALSDPCVFDRDGQRVVLGMPEQLHVDAVALARGQLAACGSWVNGLVRCAHDSSLRFADVAEHGARDARRLCGAQGKRGRVSRSSRRAGRALAPVTRHVPGGAWLAARAQRRGGCRKTGSPGWPFPG